MPTNNLFKKDNQINDIKFNDLGLVKKDQNSSQILTLRDYLNKLRKKGK